MIRRLKQVLGSLVAMFLIGTLLSVIFWSWGCGSTVEPCPDTEVRYRLDNPAGWSTVCWQPEPDVWVCALFGPGWEEAPSLNPTANWQLDWQKRTTCVTTPITRT